MVRGRRGEAKSDIVGAVFGHIRGIPVGTRWDNRKSLSASHVHPPLVAGIYGRKANGARSVVLAGEFADEDFGDRFTYIGSGGREPGVRFGPQTLDQSFANNLNEALRMSACLKNPVRVIRGHGLKSKYAPQAGFRYDGLYRVSNPRLEEAPNGFKVCKFDFTRITGQEPLPLYSHPDPYKSDIDVRRAGYRASRPGPSRDHTAPEPSRSSGSRDTPISIDDTDDDQEDLFGDMDDVQCALAPVSRILNELNRTTDNEKSRRKKLLFDIGCHVDTILLQKAAIGHDEGGRTAEWWRHALWSYVSTKLPTDKVMPPEHLEGVYQKYKEKRADKQRRDSVPNAR